MKGTHVKSENYESMEKILVSLSNYIDKRIGKRFQITLWVIDNKHNDFYILIKYFDFYCRTFLMSLSYSFLLKCLAHLDFHSVQRGMNPTEENLTPSYIGNLTVSFRP